MFYEIIAASMLISYATTQRINMVQVVKRGFEKHDYTILKNDFNTRYGRIAALARENIQTSSKVVWMCDSLTYTEDDESIQITNFLTGYIDNEINLNKDGSCWNSCADYKWTQNYGCSDGTFCDRQRRMGHVSACNGTIVDCSYIESSMLICQSADRGSNRRYDNIKFDSGIRFGQRPCTAKPSEVSSWWNIFLMHCSYCFCYCDSYADSDRYFSLQPAVSTIRKNKIITGVGITKRNGIFSWTIIQSKLLSNGRVQQISYNNTHDSEFGRRYQGFTEKITDDEREFIVQDFRRSDFGIFEGVDYFTLSWQNRSVNLDTITVPPGCVVTGVRFTVVKEHLNFEIRYTQFNFNTGRLYGRSEWISSKNEKRSVLLLHRPAPSRPINQFETKRSVPNLSSNKFIKFRPSDPEKDAGQTTVPFIDNQIVRPKVLTLLSGVGIYYKGLSGYGGFIAPKIFVYDMSSYLGN
ncbi:hypothetical protein HA402_002135 [Bradysia odoriphaga]|nr:hypothetical protein HA402_002135 [Bradysia odoriphaga]